jgi:ABC-type protease/lipase transport system fused ATPase/permease subunit
MELAERAPRPGERRVKFLDAPLPPPLVAALRACRPHLMAAAVFSALINILLLAPTIYMMQVYDRVVPTEGRLTLLYLTLVVAFALGTQTAWNRCARAC